MTDIIKEATEFAKVEYAKHDPMHRIDHMEEVMDVALYLSGCHNGEVDMEVLKLAVIFHDISYDNYESHVDDSVKVAWDFLTEKGYPEDKTEKVVEVMFAHSGPHRRENGESKTIEGKILYDADKYHRALNPSGYEKYFHQFYLPETKKLVLSKQI